jgi:TRAP-type C4-dicarboxylate transport system permease small subunit
MSAPEPSGVYRALVIVGGTALLLAVATDALAVVGRHVGHPLLGSIEFVQATVLVASSTALVIATLARRHAVVHLLVNRLEGRTKIWVERIGQLCGVILFLLFFSGSAWIAIDMWGGHEESELLRIPFAPLRLIGLAGLLAGALIFARQAIGSPRS